MSNRHREQMRELAAAGLTFPLKNIQIEELRRMFMALYISERGQSNEQLWMKACLEYLAVHGFTLLKTKQFGDTDS